MIEIPKLNTADVDRYVWHYDPATGKGKLAKIQSWKDNEVSVIYSDKSLAGVLPEQLTWSNKTK